MKTPLSLSRMKMNGQTGGSKKLMNCFYHLVYNLICNLELEKLIDLTLLVVSYIKFRS